MNEQHFFQWYTELRYKLTFCTRVKMLICAAAEYRLPFIYGFTTGNLYNFCPLSNQCFAPHTPPDCRGLHNKSI